MCSAQSLDHAAIRSQPQCRYAAATDVLEAINAAQGQLPKNLPSQPTLRKVNPADSPIFIASVQSDDVPLTTVDDYAENVLSQQLSQISGVSQVVSRRPAKARHSYRCRSCQARFSMGMTMEDVRTTLTSATVNSPKGQPGRTQNNRSPFRITTSLPSPAPYANLILAYRNGAPVRVRDIGTARRGPAE